MVVNYCHGEAAAAETAALCKELGVEAVTVQADGSVMSLANAAWIWVPLLAIATIAAWSGMNLSLIHISLTIRENVAKFVALHGTIVIVFLSREQG